MHVLIIEDEAILALDIQMFLEDLGIASSAIAATESEAVEAASQHRPDLIVSDVNLAEGTGPAAVWAIRSAIGPVPVVYVTGNVRQAEEADPGVPVLAKPIRWEELAAFVRTGGHSAANDGDDSSPSVAASI